MKIILPLDKTTVDIHKKYSNNVALTQGNRFRVGFHISRDQSLPGVKFFKINSTESALSPFRASMKQQIVPNSLMMMNCNSDEGVSPASIEYKQKLMEAALSVSECTATTDNKCPLWSPPMGLGLLNRYLAAHTEMKTNSPSLEQSVFERIITLCDALWNDLGDKQTNMPPFLHDLGRKQRFSKWLRMECRANLTKQMEKLSQQSSPIDVDKCNTVIMHALCSGEINLACQLAVATKQHRMSLLISQAASDMQSRDLIRQQLNQWLQSRTDQHVPENILCIYMLLSGQTSLVLSDGSILCPFKRLSWVQALGSHLWYHQSYLSSIKGAVELYDDAFATDIDIPAPSPMIGSPQSPIDSDDEYRYHDCCYHLVKLHCDRLHELDRLLNPPTMSQNDAHHLSRDWSASWHLAAVLASIGYINGGDGDGNGIAEKISMEWAAQLERDGLWPMAVFVAMHIGEEHCRTSMVRGIIDRHVDGSMKELSEDERFLVERLRVPTGWIHEAKAVHCKAVGDNRQLEAFHWMRAGQWEKSHRIYVDDVIPDMIVGDKFDAVRDILHQFVRAGADKLLAVAWPAGGELYLRYVDIVTSWRTMKLTNRLANHSLLVDIADCDADEDIDYDLVTRVHSIKADVGKFGRSIDGFHAQSDAQKVCKQQFLTICRKFDESWSNEIF